MSQKRTTIKLKQPNPLFEQWLTEWRDQEKQKASKKEHCFNKALESLRKYPLPLAKGKDCLMLQGFGEKLCQMLDNKLKDHQAENNTKEIVVGKEEPPKKKPKSSPIKAGEYNLLCQMLVDNKLNVEQPEDTTNEIVISKELPPKKKSKKSPIKITEYNPPINSGPYDLLLALIKSQLGPNPKGFLYKEEIIAVIKAFSDKASNDTSYTAWSSMRTLLSKNLVIKDSNPPKFSLTQQGKEVAESLYEKLSEEKKLLIIETVFQPKLFQHKSSSMQSETTNASDIIMSENSFKVFLIVDKQETAGKSHEEEMIFELNRLHAPYEIRHLKVGDYAWICKDGETGEELVLPYIVERKRMDDFGASIKDGRFHEQKFRLKQSGVQNLIYLVESRGSNSHTGLPLSTLYQAATNTLIQDGFCVKFTENIKETIGYLVHFTNILSNVYKTKTLIGCNKNDLVKSSIQDDMISLMTFKEFNQGASKAKNFKVHDFFIKQLLQLKGVSVDRALAITEVYSTPRILFNKYDQCSPNEGEALLSNITFGKLGKKIGSVISKTVYQLYSSRKY